MKIALIFVCIAISGGLGKNVCEQRTNERNYSGRDANCGKGLCYCNGETANCTGDMNQHIPPFIDWHVTILHLQCYNFSNLTRGTFKNIRHLRLQEIHLVQNFVYNISSDVFSDFDQLTVIQIGENINVNMNRSALYVALGSIQKTLPINLTIARAGIKNLNPNVFRYLKDCIVTTLSLPNNKIKYLYMDVLNMLPFLKILRIPGNRLESKRGNTSLVNLEELDLSRNKIHQKHLKFCYQVTTQKADIPFFPNLKTLILSHNYIRTNARRFSKIWHCLDKLEYLDLSNNSMDIVNISSFTRLTSVKELSLASNWITHIEPGDFPPNLTNLNFYNNHFTRFPQNLCKGLGNKTFPNIRMLNFGWNYIQKLNVKDDNCVCMPNIEILDYSRNDISVLENGTFSNCRKLKTLYLNDLIPDSKVFHPAAFESRSLQNLYIRGNKLDFEENLHKYLFHFSPNITHLDISYNVLKDMSLFGDMLSSLTNLEELIIQGLDLEKFPDQLLTILPELSVLDMDDNLLHTVIFDLMNNASEMELKIQNISIANNLVTTIDERAFPPYILQSLRYLNLADNEFLCDCEMEWFRDQVNSSGYIGNIQLTHWPELYICSSPLTLEGHMFQDFQPDIICKPMDPAVIAAIAIGSFLVVFILVASVGYWNRWHIRYYFYKIRRRIKDSDAAKDPENQPILDRTLYDVYVVSNTNDDHFVHHPFLKLMEEQLGYKLHIWKRDAKNGIYVDVVLDAMYASKQIAVIVSNNLVADKWCKFQVDVAINLCIERQKSCLLLVVLEDIDFKPVSKSWCVLLAKTPTAHWSSNEDSNKYKLFEETVKEQFGTPTSYCNQYDSIN